jgi:hypothetical protein
MDNYDKLFTTIENYQNMTVAYLAVSLVSIDCTVFVCLLNEYPHSIPRSARVSFASTKPGKDSDTGFCFAIPISHEEDCSIDKHPAK